MHRGQKIIWLLTSRAKELNKGMEKIQLVLKVLSKNSKFFFLFLCNYELFPSLVTFSFFSLQRKIYPEQDLNPLYTCIFMDRDEENEANNQQSWPN